MCGFASSYNSEFLYESYHRMKDRGNGKATFTAISPKISKPFVCTVQDIESILNIYDSVSYKVLHIQAETAKGNPPHPATIGDQYLWHNGLLKDSQIHSLNREMDSDDTWDTMQILKVLQRFDLKKLGELDGSFACIRAQKNTVDFFRNDLVQIFRKGTDFSTVEFPGSSLILSGHILCHQIGSDCVSDLGKCFETKEMPYYIGE